MIFKKFHLLFVFIESILKYGELDETSTEEFEELHKTLVKEPLQSASNAHQIDAIIASYTRFQISRPLLLKELQKKLNKIKTPISSPKCSSPPNAVCSDVFSILLHKKFIDNLQKKEDISVHNSVKLIGYQNTQETPFHKLVCSKSFHNKPRNSFFQYLKNHRFFYAQVQCILSLNGVPYCLSFPLSLLPLQPDERVLNSDLYELSDSIELVPVESITSSWHFIPDAHLNDSFNLCVQSKRFWQNSNALLF